MIRNEWRVGDHLSKPTPNGTAFYRADKGLPDTISFGDDSLPSFVGANRKDLSWGEFSGGPSSGHFIVRILGNRPEFEMLRVDADRIVTLMPHTKPARNYPTVDFVRNAMCQSGYVAPPEAAVPIVLPVSFPGMDNRASPRPATVFVGVPAFFEKPDHVKPLEDRYFLILQTNRPCRAGRQVGFVKTAHVFSHTYDESNHDSGGAVTWQ